MITVTPQAAKQILQSRDESGDESGKDRLRLAAKRLADGSFDYAMGFDNPQQHDQQANSNGVSVIIAPTSLEFLRGATLDYVELQPGQCQFIFMNPNDPTYIPPQE